MGRIVQMFDSVSWMYGFILNCGLTTTVNHQSVCEKRTIFICDFAAIHAYVNCLILRKNFVSFVLLYLFVCPWPLIRQ